MVFCDGCDVCIHQVSEWSQALALGKAKQLLSPSLKMGSINVFFLMMGVHKYIAICICNVLGYVEF